VLERRELFVGLKLMMGILNELERGKEAKKYEYTELE
jgi:hypothetical protein